MSRKFHASEPKKCKATGKTKFRLEKDAGRAMMRTWSHDSSMNIYDYHTYLCPDCKTYHFGNKKHYEKVLQKNAPQAPVQTSAV